MAELDPSIILRAGAGQPLQFADVLEKRAQLQARNLQGQREQQQYDRQARQDAMAVEKQQRLRDVGKAYGAGDRAGARGMAAADGDFDLVSRLDQMDDAGRKRTFEISQGTAPLLLSLKTVSPEQTGAALQQIAPQLQERGFTPEQIQQVAQQLANPDPAARQAAFASIQNSAMTIAEYQKANEGFTLGADQQRFDSTGKVIASGPESVKYVTTPEGGTTTIIQGGNRGGAPVGAQIEQAITSFVPGVQVTSRQRSPQKNAAVGGVPNSYHLSDNARDFVPPPGMSLSQLASATRAKLGPGFKVIAESDHVHVEPNGGPRTIQGAPKTDKAPSGYRYKGDGTLEPIPGGPGDKAKKLIPVSPPVVRGYIENNQSIRNIDRAMTALNKYPNAVGLGMGILPDAITQRTDPKGVEARAAISNIGSLIIHDRSGAAVTASETPRLKPFIPNNGDDAPTVRKKLAQLRAAIAEMQSDIDAVYNPEQGYRSLPKLVAPKPAVPKGPPSGRKSGNADIDAILRRNGVIK